MVPALERPQRAIAVSTELVRTLPDASSSPSKLPSERWRCRSREATSVWVRNWFIRCDAAMVNNAIPATSDSLKGPVQNQLVPLFNALSRYWKEPSADGDPESLSQSAYAAGAMLPSNPGDHEW